MSTPQDGGAAPSTPDVPGYSNLTRIGRGGFSVVYSATHERLGRQVALKVLLADLVDARDARRFEAECRALGALGEHPNIVDVYDAGVTADGRPFIAMRLYEHGTFADRLAERGPLPAAEVIEIGAAVAEALAFAHGQGVIHRDIKPENLLIGEDARPVVTDFGVAALADESGRYTTSIAFTSSHVAPEVLDRNEYGVPSDLYALGSTLYALLTGHAVFEETSEAKRIIAVMTAPPSNLPDGICPPALNDLIQACLYKDPHNRPASALYVVGVLSHMTPPEDTGTRRLLEHQVEPHPPGARIETGTRRPETASPLNSDATKRSSHPRELPSSEQNALDGATKLSNSNRDRQLIPADRTANLASLLALAIWIAYTTTRVFMQKWYWGAENLDQPYLHYLTPFYLPCISDGCIPDAAMFGTFLPYVWWLPFAPLTLPLLWAMSFAVYSYQRNIDLTPGESAPTSDTVRARTGKRTSTKTRISQRIFVSAAVLLAVVSTDVFVRSFTGRDGQFGLGFGSLILGANMVIMWAYCTTCLSIPGRTRAQAHVLQQRRHRQVRLGWIAILTLTCADLYVMAVAASWITDIRIYN